MGDSRGWIGDGSARNRNPATGTMASPAARERTRALTPDVSTPTLGQGITAVLRELRGDAMPDDSSFGSGPGSGAPGSARNILGGALQTCSTDPMTGFLRDGCCTPHPMDRGNHSVCAVVTQAFLDFTAERGNDLATPRPEFGFEGLKPGDRWCLCAARWLEAEQAGVGPPIVPEATSERALEVVEREVLMRRARQ
jgi:hypothetical protein